MNKLSKDLILYEIVKKHLQRDPLSIINLSKTNKRIRYVLKDQIEKINRWKSMTKVNDGLYQASLKGYRDLVDLFIKKGANYWNWALEGACIGGHRNLVDLLIEKGANDWNRALRGACIGGYRDLVDLFIKKGANDWDWALRCARIGGHRDLIEFFTNRLDK